MPTLPPVATVESSQDKADIDRVWHTGTRTTGRLATLDGLDAVNAFHTRCSLDTRYARYQRSRLLRLAEFEGLIQLEGNLTWVSHPDTEPDKIIATTDLVRSAENDTAELSIMIEEG